jgi:hypothetical protein
MGWLKHPITFRREVALLPTMQPLPAPANESGSRQTRPSVHDLRPIFETLRTRLFRDRVDGTHAEAPARRRGRGQAVREVLAPILTFVSVMTSR